MVNPTFADISAELGVAESTLLKWRKEMPEISDAIARGKQRIMKPVAAAVLKGAQAGDPKMIDRFLKMFRADIHPDKHATNIFNGTVQVNIVPTPQDLKE